MSRRCHRESFFLAVVIDLLIGWIDGWTGASRHALVTGWPIGAQVAFFVISHDLYIYWFHRLQHGNRWLWRLHEAHHSARHVDWIAGSRSHSFEILINQSIEFGAMILLGASVEAILIKGAISAVWGMWIHANVHVRSGRLQWVINGPAMHRWHHAIDHPQGGCNFGTKLAIWDWIFGTAYRPAKSRPGTGSPRRTRGGTWSIRRSRSGRSSGARADVAHDRRPRGQHRGVGRRAEEEYFIGSADWMTRKFESRVEGVTPVGPANQYRRASRTEFPRSNRPPHRCP